MISLGSKPLFFHFSLIVKPRGVDIPDARLRLKYSVEPRTVSSGSFCVTTASFLQRLLHCPAFLLICFFTQGRSLQPGPCNLRLLMSIFVNTFQSDFSSGKMKRITRAARAAEVNSQSSEDQQTSRPRRQLITSIVQSPVPPALQTPLQHVPARRSAPSTPGIVSSLRLPCQPFL